MRFFTVPTAKDARKSVIWAMAIIGGFYVLTSVPRHGSAMNVGADQIRADRRRRQHGAPLLAQALGGGADSLLGNSCWAFVAGRGRSRRSWPWLPSRACGRLPQWRMNLWLWRVIRSVHVSPLGTMWRRARIATVNRGGRWRSRIGDCRPRRRTSRIWWRWRSLVAASGELPCACAPDAVL
jgi:hypothetical protein